MAKVRTVASFIACTGRGALATIFCYQCEGPGTLLAILGHVVNQVKR